ncbi:hypothetical protein C8F04DRAFT_1138389 [Mycena alexandri]|uniref:NAD(P)-binding protein n=1 Tax=Mycena alexandri TaxID=1745969 RepID=A0AAD6S6W4_9AGAR|nr:hypothetical protein C8F04DRAFT_1138389 [Mycena alexandri]
MHIANVWLITGASGGFGACLVKSILARGDRVIATARSLNKIPLEGIPQSKLDNDLRLLTLDVTAGEEAITKIMEEAFAFWGRIDVLVNNAGYVEKMIMEEGGSARLKKQFEANVFGPLDVTTAVLPYMRAARSGTIVMIGSRTSWRPEIPSLGPYAASKAALRVFSETLAVELAPFSIRMLIVEPAAFLTNTMVSTHIYEGNKIPDYDALRFEGEDVYKRAYRTLKGDPAKAMEAVVDVVRGEGKAKGRAWPGMLVLGDVGVSGVKEKCEQVMGLLEEWRDVSTTLNFDTEES